MTLRAVLALGFVLTSVGVRAADGPAIIVDGAQSAPITAKNWKAHPTIVAIRSLVQSNEASITSGRWRKESGGECLCEKHFCREERSFVRDEKGTIREFIVNAGSDDSSYTVKHQYDAAGRLRFAYGTAGAIGDPESGGHSYIKYRLYFSEDGQLVWRDRRVEGPFRPWMDGFQDRMLVREPEKALASKLVCPEG